MSAGTFRASPERRALCSQIARIAGADGPDDPRLPALRDQLDRITVEEIHQWALRMRETLPPYNQTEIRQAGRAARDLDRRRASQAASAEAAAS